jgi:hypothetical protein
MAVHGCAWLCMAVHGCAWLCIAVHGCAWLCIAVHQLFTAPQHFSSASELACVHGRVCVQTPKFVMVSSAGVTRPDRPGIKVEEEPPAVKLNAELGGLLTYKLAGVAGGWGEGGGGWGLGSL